MSNPKDFVHLHLHTDYSLLKGTIQLAPLVERLEELEMAACAITDNANMYGAISFYEKLTKAGIKPIIGYESLLTFSDFAEKNSIVKAGERPYYPLVLLATSFKGYSNLCELASRAFTEGFHQRPLINLGLLEQFSEDLIAISGGGRDVIGHFLNNGNNKRAQENADALLALFDNQSFYIEIQNHGIETQIQQNQLLVDFARENDLPLVATNDVYYLNKDDARAHEILMCIGEGKTINDSTHTKFESDNYYLRSKEEMWDLFGEQFPEALENTVKIANRCNVEIPLGTQLFLPKFPIPDEFGSSDLSDYFESVVWEGFEQRRTSVFDAMEKNGELKYTIDVYKERLAKEIEIIRNMGFPGYFLIVWDFMRYAKQEGIPVGPGRGSAAGSLVAYCLEITDIDPIQYDLLFERFLNPERVSMPDIDIDFCVRGRGRVIDYVSELYGRESVCQIITFGTMASKAAIKDVGRALQIPYAEVEKIAKMIPPPVRGRNVSISQAIEQVSELRSAMKKDAKTKELVDMALRIEGCSRHTSVHAAGVVISPRPLNELVPVAISSRNEELTSQYSMKDLEKTGMLKMDFLALTTLTVIDDCLTALKQKKNIVINWNEVSLKDEKTFKLFGDGLTEAIFQFESGGMQEICRKLKPKELEDLSALNALYRPGPLDGGMVDDFIARHKGEEKVEYIVPEMEEILKNTYGILVYQEQIMQLAQRLAGYSLGKADEMRRAMGKKDRSIMAEHEIAFTNGAVKKKVPKKKAEEIFNLMRQFADYGFNRSHSFAYAYVAFQTAYLKAHYPAYFYASVLTSEADNAEKIYKYSTEMRNYGLSLLPPDVNESDTGFTPRDDAVRFGITAIKGIGSSTVEAIIKAREKNGLFTSLFDFASRVEQGSINRRGMESLIGAGAFDSLLPEGSDIGVGRAQMFASISDVLNAGNKAWSDLERGQTALFGASETGTEISFELKSDFEPWSRNELSAHEKSAVGFYLSSHPLDVYTEMIDGLGLQSISHYSEVEPGARIELAGMVVRFQAKYSKKGNRFCIFRLEDQTGGVKCLGWAEMFKEFGAMLEDEALVKIAGRVESNEGQEVTVIVDDVRLLEDIRFERFSLATIDLPKNKSIDVVCDRIFGLLNGADGKCKVTLRVPLESGITAELHPDFARVDLSVEKELEKLGCKVSWS